MLLRGSPFNYIASPEGDVGVAERGADNLDADLVRFRRIDDDLLDGERLAGASADRRCLLPSMVRDRLASTYVRTSHPWRAGRS
jgi:hypothetical protein